MNFKTIIKKALPHIGIIIGFMAISYIYFYPVIQGKVLQQSDVMHHQGTVHQIKEYNNENPDDPTLWTPYSFSGMPTFKINSGENPNIFSYIKKFLRSPLPYKTGAILFTYLLCFYILGLSLNLNRWLSVIGAIAFAFVTYKIIIIGAGHITKAYSIGMFPLVLAGIILLYRDKYILGGIVSLLGIGMEVQSSHPQMAYYVAITAVIIVLAKFVESVKHKSYKHFIRASVLLLIAVILGVLPALKNLWSTYEYGKKTIRGEQIIQKSGEQDDGLDKDYALSWSYGKWETLTLLIPNFHGGASHGELDNDSKVYEGLKKKGVPPQKAQKITQSLSTYWGKQPFTEGPVYIGAIICFLAVLGLFNNKGYLKWGLLISSVLAILLSWGSNFKWFTDIFFYYFPLYDKFRTVSSILVIVGLNAPILAILGLKNYIQNKTSPLAFKQLKKAYFIVGGIALFFVLFPGLFFDFSSPVDNRYLSGGYPEWLVDLLRENRKVMLRADAFRSLVFITLAFGIIWLYTKNKLQTTQLYILMGALVLIDLWSVNKRYVNNDDFVNERQQEAQFQKTKADQYILQDTSYYRVLNLQKPFQEVHTSYYHHSVGGYHGAKLRRYQDLIERQLQPTIKSIKQALNQKSNQQQAVNSLLQKANALNMLNTKYIIYNPQNRPIRNPNALGPAWFVDSITFVENALQEIQAIDRINPANEAIIHQEFKEDIGRSHFSPDSSANIRLVKNEPNHLVYQTSTHSKQLAVLSEVYYPFGWKATLDGEETPIYRANYLLRAVEIPEGNHTLELEFRPQSYYTGLTISRIGSYLVAFILLFGIGFGIYRAGKQQKPDNPET